MAYFAPFALTQTDGVVKAKAFAPHMSASDETESVAYELKVSDPVFAPDGGVFVDSVTLAISSATPGAAIHYTLDGSDPVGTSPMYTAPFAVGVTDLAVKAVALHKGLAPSNVVESAVYTVKASAPVLDPMEGDFTAEALIKVTSATTGARFAVPSMARIRTTKRGQYLLRYLLKRRIRLSSALPRSMASPAAISRAHYRRS